MIELIEDDLIEVRAAMRVLRRLEKNLLKRRRALKKIESAAAERREMETHELLPPAQRLQVANG